MVRTAGSVIMDARTPGTKQLCDKVNLKKKKRKVTGQFENKPH